MKNTTKALKISLVFSILVSLFLACDKDFSVIDSDVLDEDNLNFSTDTTNLTIAAYNKKLEGLQINGLSSYLLGVYIDPAYGKTTASIVAQVTPTKFPKDFGTNPIIDSVVISVPYFSRITETKDGETTYTILDSLYGKKPDEDIKPFKLTIYQNNFFLNDFDPDGGLTETQKYYSKADNINSTDNFALNGRLLINFDSNNNKGAAIYTNNSFKPSDKAIKTSVGTGDKKVTSTTAPAFRDKLDPAFWKAAIIDKAGSSVLNSQAEFKNYFKGLYFKAEAIDENGSMVLLNLASTNANITIYYSKDSAVAGEKTQDTYVLNFSGNILNPFINDYSSVPLKDGDKALGDQKLYLKGAEGSMAVVDLFSGMVECEDENGNKSMVSALNCFKSNFSKKDSNGNNVLKRIINDAQLIVYEDDNIEKGGNANLHKYDRIYAYDIKNSRPLIDYQFDPTSGNNTSPLNSTIFHLGKRPIDSKKPVKYKIHLTEHLNNILLRDSTNTKIGLVLSSNVNLVNNSKILNSTGEVTNVPAVSVITPRGTILYGTNAAVPNNRKMKLKIFYTELK